MIKLKPFIQSDDSLCGPASLKMVLDYHGIDVTEEELAVAMNHTYASGCTNEDIARAARAYGMLSMSTEYATFKDLEWSLNKGYPVIIDWFCGDIPDGHASVVVGLDDMYIYIQDPLYEEVRTLTREDFYRVWFDFRETPISPDNLVIRYALMLIPAHSLLFI